MMNKEGFNTIKAERLRLQKTLLTTQQEMHSHLGDSALASAEK